MVLKTTTWNKNKPYNERMKVSFSEQNDLFVHGLYYIGKKNSHNDDAQTSKCENWSQTVCVGNTGHILVLTITNPDLTMRLILHCLTPLNKVEKSFK